MSISTRHQIYTGSVRHRRLSPFNHTFTYKLFMVYLDLDSLDTVLPTSWFWNVEKRAIVSFHRQDFHGDPKLSLDTAVRKTIQERTGVRPAGPIRLVAHLRYAGYCFNPVSFYYCFDQKDSFVETILAEVTNTPWQERHSYIVTKEKIIKGQRNLSSIMPKKLHVSPFWDMEHTYDWTLTQPEKNLRVHMKNYRYGDHVFDATLSMERQALTRRNLMKKVLAYPFITLRVVLQIHWQAAKLWLKGATFFTHPEKLKAGKHHG